jgi:hypothetical protein
MSTDNGQNESAKLPQESRKDIEDSRFTNMMKDIKQTGSPFPKLPSENYHQPSNPFNPPSGMPPPSNGSGGGQRGGGSNSSSWFGQGKQNFLIIILIGVVALLIVAVMSSRNDGNKIQQSEIVQRTQVQPVVTNSKVPQINKDIADAEKELALAEIKAKTAEAKAKESLVSGGIQSTKNQTVLRVTEPPSTFDCSTVEKMKANFITERTIEGEQGTQLLLKGGCAKVRFNHKITFLEGDGYLVTFDSMEDPNPHMCGNGHGRRNDPPETCIKLLNEHEGETFFVGNKESNSYVKIGG